MIILLNLFMIFVGILNFLLFIVWKEKKWAYVIIEIIFLINALYLIFYGLYLSGFMFK